MKLKAWAKKQGISYLTAYRWFKAGKMPVPAYQSLSGTIIVEEEKVEQKKNTAKVAIYVRVSSHGQKEHLTGQEARCMQYAIAKGYQIAKVYKEVASGINDNRKQFWSMIEAEPDIIICEHKDRLTRFGFNYIERLLEKRGCKIEVLNRDHQEEADLAKDMISIVTVFCCKLYGLRRGIAKRKALEEELSK